MADEKRKTPDSGESARRRRPAPTIDLTATEISGAAAPPQASAEPPPAKDPPPAAAFATGATKPERLRADMMSSIIAGLSGAAMAALVLLAAWLLAPARPDNAAAVSTRIDALEKQVRDAAGKTATPADTIAAGELKERIGKLEQSLGNRPAGDPGAAERLAALENTMKALGIALTALNHRAEEIAANVASIHKSAADNDALQKRLDALESAAKAMQDKETQNASADNAARLALASVALREAVSRGKPFSVQLAAVRSLGADPKSLMALEPFAAAGVPSEAAMARELTALLPAMLEASGANVAATGSFIERLQANAGKLVRIRPADEPAGAAAAAVMARLEVKAARGDMTGSQVEIAQLPPKARAPATPWIKKFEARAAAVAAADALVGDATRTIDKSP